jgi:hypothetical protein
MFMISRCLVGDVCISRKEARTHDLSWNRGVSWGFTLLNLVGNLLAPGFDANGR